jgi:phage terminase small subunit
MAKLTDKQRAFAEAYLKTFNATKAAIAAGYSEKSATSQGSQLLHNPKVEAYLHARMQKSLMSTNEVLYHLAQIARGDVDDLLNEYGNLDIEKARRLGVTNLIRKVRNRQTTTENSTTFETETEGYDRMRALELIGKYLALWTDKVKVEDWRNEALADIRAGKMTYGELAAQDKSLADELFSMAGVPIGDSSISSE